MLEQDFSWPSALLDFPAVWQPNLQNDALFKARRCFHFGQPLKWLVAYQAAQVPALLNEAHQLSKAGFWCLGWVNYEAAPGFNPNLPVKATRPGTVYAAWAVYDHFQDAWPTLNDAQNWQLAPWACDLTKTQQASAMAHIQHLIQAGEVYQINLTAQLSSGFAGQTDTPALHHLFRALHRAQPNGYSLMLDARAVSQQPGVILSVSPELFFQWDGQQIVTQPMKGTSKRHTNPIADQAAADHLRCSEKERAENLMIVDLMRNDLSRVAITGSVQVQSLFDVQALPTVWQMTSTVQAKTRPEVRLADIFSALFPCGSVTGAPKQRAMHHIAQIEKQPRQVYCGAMGVLMPGGLATFNVPIRTLCIDTPPPNAPWKINCGIGSGITLDAIIADEQKEWTHKQIFLQRASIPFDIIESMRLENGVYMRLPLHIQRLERTAQHFGFTKTNEWPIWRDRILQTLAQCAQTHCYGSFKLRLLCSAQGHIKTNVEPLLQPFGSSLESLPNAFDLLEGLSSTPVIDVALATSVMPDADEFIWHKTTRRQAYLAHTPIKTVFDTLLYNERGELTEFTKGNVAVRIAKKWLTPAIDCGLLPGVMRQALIDAHALEESIIVKSQLDTCEGLIFMNSVRGILPAKIAYKVAPC